MKVFFLSPFDHNHSHSGAKIRVNELIKILSKKHKVGLLAPWKNPDAFFNIGINFNASTIYYFLKSIFIIFLKRPNILISESPISFSIPMLTKTYLVIHDTKFATNHGRKYKNLSFFLYYLSSRLCNGVITVSKTEAENISKLLRIPLNKIKVSYNGININWMNIKNEIRPKERIYDFIYVSNFAKHKGHLNLLEILAEYFPDSRTCFVGSDFGTGDNIRKYISKKNLKVEIYNNISQEKLQHLYLSSKVFVFPSMLEGFGIPYIEARACGCSIITNNLKVFIELSELLGGENHDIEDKDLFASRMHYLLNNFKSNDYIDLKIFDWSNIATQLIDMLTKVK